MFDLSKFRARHIAKRTAVAAGALVALTVISLTGAQAAPITTPSGLSAGDTYRLAFVTSFETDATSSDINYYNDFVTFVASTSSALAALGTTWTAMAAAGDTNERVNTGTDGPGGSPVYLLDGATKIADNNADLWDDTLDAAISRNQNNDVFLVRVWTGFGPPLHRLGGPEDPTVGFSGASDHRWGEDLELFRFDEYSVYALSGILTVQAAEQVSEPGGLIILCFGLAGLGYARRRRAA